MFSVSACEATSVQTVLVETQSLHHASPENGRNKSLPLNCYMSYKQGSNKVVQRVKGSKVFASCLS